MADHTLPGDVPGLLRPGSPVLCGHRDCVVVLVDIPCGSGGAIICDDTGVIDHNGTTHDCLSLDLTDPTGRIHALWWWMQYAGTDFRASSVAAALPRGASWAHIEARVLRGDDLTPDDLDTFCRVMRAAVEVVRG